MPDPTVAEAAAGADLYGLDPADFTAARNALVKQLKKDGRKDEAAAVGALRRPPLTAWALNQVARNQRDIVDAVLAAGDALRGAMDAALEGDASRVRSSQVDERASVDVVVDAAVAQLSALGRAPTEDARWKMSQTLRAAMVDDKVADRLRGGVLDADVESSGFGTFGIADAVTSTPRVAARKPAAATKAKPGAKAADEVGAKRDQRDEEARVAREEQRQAARDRASVLEAGAQRLADDAARRQAEAEHAAQRAGEARRAAEQAAVAADEAAVAAEEAQGQAAEADRLARQADADAAAARTDADALDGPDGD